MRRFFYDCEEWRPVIGHPHYEISNLGRVRSVDRTLECADGRPRRFRGSLVKSRPDKRMGYHRVVLYERSKWTARTVHSLVAEAFLGLRPDGQEVRHLNGNPGDNCATNLTYGTRRENNHDKRQHGTDHQLNKVRCPRGHDLAEPNLVRSKLKRNQRDCLTCARTRAYCAYHPEAAFQETADRYYVKIMGTVTK